jgi:hypothetical protein
LLRHLTLQNKRDQNYRPLVSLLNAHFHQSIVSVNHSLKSDTLHRATIGATFVCFSITCGPGTPIVPLHRALHDRTVVNTHSRTYRSPLKTGRIKIVISSPLVVQLPRYICCCGYGTRLRSGYPWGRRPRVIECIASWQYYERGGRSGE